MNSAIIPDHMLSKMSAADRKALGKRGRTMTEIALLNEAKSEKELQQTIAQWLDRHHWYHIRSRMDKRTTTRKGTPDFIIFPPGGRAVVVECKRPGGVVSTEQAEACSHLRNLGYVVLICTSFMQFHQWIRAVAPMPTPI